MHNELLKKITSIIFALAFLLTAQLAYDLSCYDSSCSGSLCYATPYYLPGTEKFDGYPSFDGDPSVKAVDSKKGTGKFIEFGDAKYPSKTPDNIFDPGSAVSNNYPDKDVPEKQGTGKYIMFSGGSLQYPSNYHDPADDVPMVIMNSEDAKKAPPKKMNTPSGICPLSALKIDRDKFRTANKQKREKLLSRFAVGANYMAVYARRQELPKPKVLGNSIVLVSTKYNAVSKQWKARIYLAAGFRCQKGYHDLEQDDSITDEVSVLAIGNNVVLLQVGEQLAYLRPKNTDPYQFRMIWDTGIELEFDESTDKISGKKSSKKSKKKKSKKKKKKRRKSIKSQIKR